MEYKRIIGKADLFVSDNGWMYTTDSWGKYEKLKRTVRGKHYFSYFEGDDYKICNIVYTYFVENIPSSKQVHYIKGKNPKLSNLILVTKGFDRIIDVEGKTLSNGWSVESVIRDSPNRRVLASCPCGNFKKEINYTSLRSKTKVRCECNETPRVRKIDSELYTEILADYNSGTKVKDICTKYDITDTTFYNIKNNVFNYEEKVKE